MTQQYELRYSRWIFFICLVGGHLAFSLITGC